MNQVETQLLASAGSHLGVAFGIIAKYMELTQENEQAAAINEMATAWMKSVVANILSTDLNPAKDNAYLPGQEAAEEEKGYGSGV